MTTKHKITHAPYAQKQTRKLAIAGANIKLQNPGLVTYYDIRQGTERANSTLTPNPCTGYTYST